MWRKTCSLTKRHSLVLSGFLVACLLLLSACTNHTSDQRATHLSPAHPQSTVTSLQIQEGQLQLQSFQQWIALLQHSQGNVDKYQREYTSSQQSLNLATTNESYQKGLQSLSKQVESIKTTAMAAEANILERQLRKDTVAWGGAHSYTDGYNGVAYPDGYEYSPDGVDGWAQDDITNAKTLTDYQQAVEELNIWVTHFQAYKTNTKDTTTWNHMHKTDIGLIKHYAAMHQKVVVVSLGEQAMRIYNNGQLVNAFQITTGRPDRPSPPGAWQVEDKESPTIFKSGVPPGSPYWYPDTPIHYAMQYHSGGYFIHDSWWRSDYGPGTQFPHADSSGDSFSSNGSHGCINVEEGNAAWLYDFVDINTRVVVY